MTIIKTWYAKWPERITADIITTQECPTNGLYIQRLSAREKLSNVVDLG